MGDIRNYFAIGKGCKNGGPLMATTKPKYRQQAGAVVQHFSESTLSDLCFLMKRKPAAELIRKLEDAVTWNKIVREMPTPAETRAALKELSKKSYALWTLLQDTDEYTRRNIMETATFDNRAGVVDPVHDAKNALSDLLMAMGKTLQKEWSTHRSGGLNRKQLQTATLKNSLHSIFEKYGGKLTRGQVDACIDVIIENLPK